MKVTGFFWGDFASILRSYEMCVSYRNKFIG